MEVFTLHSRAPRARLRLAEKLHAHGLHPSVVAHAIRRVECQESVAAALLAHYRLVVNCLGQLQRECKVAVLRQRNRDPAVLAEGLILEEFETKFPRVELDGLVSYANPRSPSSAVRSVLHACLPAGDVIH
jgi:hypothetical protein